MIEAELKARVRDAGALHEMLRRRADEEISVYRDTYYDLPDQTLTTEGRELRVRIAETGGVHRAISAGRRWPLRCSAGPRRVRNPHG